MGTKTPGLPDADDGASERGEGEVGISTLFMSNGDATELGKPSHAALDFPAVSAKALTGVDAAPGEARSDAAGAALPAAPAMVAGLVGVEFVGTAARPSLTAPDAQHRIQRWHQHAAVVPVGPTDGQARRRALTIDDQMLLGARLATARRVRPGLRTPH